MKALDVTGERYGRLTALRRVANRGKHTYWLFRCDCGGEIEAHVGSARRGLTKSCGCWKTDFSPVMHRTHGMCYSAEYNIWMKAKGRCTNPSDRAYARYGGRGITMDPDWVEDFDAFFAHMGPRPRGTSLDRIDNDGPYAPGNCRWATRNEQAANKRNNLTVSYAGQSICLAEFARRCGIKYASLYYRVSRGQDAVRAAETMLKRCGRSMPA